MSTEEMVVTVLATAREPLTASAIHDRLPAGVGTGDVTQVLFSLLRTRRVLRIATGGNRYGYRLNPGSAVVDAPKARQARQARKYRKATHAYLDLLQAPLIGPLTECIERLMGQADRYWTCGEIAQSLSHELPLSRVRVVMCRMRQKGVVSSERTGRTARHRLTRSAVRGEVRP